MPATAFPPGSRCPDLDLLDHAGNRARVDRPDHPAVRLGNPWPWDRFGD